MTSSEIDAIVSDYFRRLEALLSGLPAADREQLLAEIREHVEQARSGLANETPAATRELLDRVGRPEEIAQEALGEQTGGHRRRWLIGGAIAVAVVAAVAVVLGLVATSSSSSPTQVAVAPTAAVGGFPTGIAFDPASGTVYVASGVASDLTMLDASSCNAETSSRCTDAKTVSTGGQDAIGVAVDDQTGTVYAVNGGSDSVAVINAHSCNANDASGCAKPVALVSVPGGPEFIALNDKTDTIYVADTNSGTVSMIDGTSCNASDHSGCAKTPADRLGRAGSLPDRRRRHDKHHLCRHARRQAGERRQRRRRADQRQPLRLDQHERLRHRSGHGLGRQRARRDRARPDDRHALCQQRERQRGRDQREGMQRHHNEGMRHRGGDRRGTDRPTRRRTGSGHTHALCVECWLEHHLDDRHLNL